MRITILTLGLFLMVSSQLFAQGIEFFHGSWEEALEQAKIEDKPIFVDAYASWCGPCKRMAAQVFPDKEVGEVFNANFISLKIDMEKPEAASFRSKNPVRAYPTLMFFDPEGNRIHSVVGGQQAKGLINQAREALKKVDNLPRYENRYADGDRDPAFVLKYVRALVRQGLPHLRIANEQIRSQKGKLSEPDNLRLLMTAATEADSRVFDKLVEHKSEAIALLSQEAFDKQVKLAFHNTKSKALEMESADLLEEAAKKYKFINPAAAEAYLLDGQLKMSAAGSSAKDFLKTAKKYYKKVADGDAQLLTNMFQLLSGSKFTSDKKVQDFTAMVGQNAASAKNNYRDYYLLAKWLKDVKRNDEALIAAEKSKSLIPDKQPNTQRLVDFLIKQIKEAKG